MDVVANWTRIDVLKMIFLYLPTEKAFYYTFLAVWVLRALFAYNLDSAASWWAQIIAIGITSIPVFVGCWVVLTALLLIYMQFTPGILGTHYFSITDEGLIEQTEVGETFTKWVSVTSVAKRHDAIYVGIHWASLYIIPAESFATEQAFDTFYRQLREKKDNVRKGL